MKRFGSTFGYVIVFALFLVQTSVAQVAFESEVAGVIARNCLSCHNEENDDGGISFQIRDSFLESETVVKGEPLKSELFRAITSQNGKRPRMPKDRAPLSPEEVALVRTWIEEGAEWPEGFEVSNEAQVSFDWWSFHPLHRPNVPEPDESEWVKTPIDAFVLRKLVEKGLSHSQPADRRTLIRRLTYDLTGLPPKFEDVESFVNDSSSTAYEKVVDRLLASPRYGERWAQHWLDVVKYADTCGYDKDKLRPNAWPYRDYVIRSFNDDKPYSQFIQEQLAGDAIYPNSSDGILGLGFIAAGPWDFIGHVEVPESKLDGKVARNLDRDEMVSNTVNTFMSLTVQCARCHDHKFDPFTQEHYYGLQSVFAAVDRAERVYQSDPDVEVRRGELASRLETMEGRLAEIDFFLEKRGGEKWSVLKEEIEKDSKANVSKAPEFGYHSQLSNDPAKVKWVEVDLGEKKSISQIIIRPCHDDFAGIGAGFGFPVSFFVEVDGVVVFDSGSEDFANPGMKPHSIDVKTSGQRVRVSAKKLAARGAEFIFALAELQVIDAQKVNVALGKKVEAQDSIEAPIRWGKQNLTDGVWFEDAENKQKAEAARKLQDLELKILGKDVHDERNELRKTIKETAKTISDLPRGQLVYAATTDFAPEGNFHPTKGVPRKVQVLNRGNVGQPLRLSSPGALPLSKGDEFRFELSEDHIEMDRREALAKWIASPKNPLTWRSIVNRVWQHHFGQGIVATPNDFGSMGALPTHPELLDWLAVEFRDNGGSLKRLHRMIVLSSTYQQASQHREENAALDSSNQFLWRMSRRKLSAEELRDSILTVAGVLDFEMGGPGYYLFALERAEHSPHFEYHKFDHNNPQSYRRSVYRFIVRSQPDPFLTCLDGADNSQSTPRRNETQTPLQALSLLNNQFNLVMAEQFAKQLDSNVSAEAKVNMAIKVLLGRNATRSERDTLSTYLEKHGTANLARILFNLSEFLFVE